MSAREWKPGDLAMVRAKHGPTEVGAEDVYPMTRYRNGWALLSGDYFWPDHLASPIRPLIVIDPEDREQVERLIDAIHTVSGQGPATVTDRYTLALREFANPTPPKPDEPPPWSVVVVADSTPFTRIAEGHITPPYSACWFGEHPRTGNRDRLTWGELHALGDVEIVGKGVTQ